LEVEPSKPQGKTFTTTEEARASDVMPWEQFDGTSPIQETPLPTSSNPVIESLDVPGTVIDPAPVGLAPQELETPPSESTGPIQGANDEEGVTPSAGSPGLSSPMPWEQRENSTVKIEETASSTAPLAQLDETPILDDQSVLTQSANTQPESVSGQLSSSVPVPDLTEPGESIFAAEPSTIPSVLPEPEAPTPSSDESSSTVPFSWNTVFDGAWKFASGTLSSSSPAAPSKPDADSSQASKDLDSLQPESVPDPALFSPSSPST